MSKISITIEDVPGEGVIIVGDPSMEALMKRLQSREQLSIGESLGVCAWLAIGEQARRIGQVQAGETN